MPISAVDTITLAFQHTKRQLVQPFRFWQWTRLALVGLLAGEMGSGSCNVPSNFNLPQQTGNSRQLLDTGFGSIDPALYAGLIAVLVVLFFASRSIVPTLPLLILWGGLAFALVSPLQIWVVDAATDAPNLASTLNQGAFNLGNATGAWLGGVALTAGASYQQLPLLGALVAAIALAFTLTTLVNPRVMPVQIRPAE